MMNKMAEQAECQVSLSAAIYRSLQRSRCRPYQILLHFWRIWGTRRRSFAALAAFCWSGSVILVCGLFIHLTGLCSTTYNLQTVLAFRAPVRKWYPFDEAMECFRWKFQCKIADVGAENASPSARQWGNEWPTSICDPQHVSLLLVVFMRLV